MTTATWFPTLMTRPPQEGCELAITLHRRGVQYTPPDVGILKSLRADAENAHRLMALVQVVAVNCQTVAAANNCWRK